MKYHLLLLSAACLLYTAAHAEPQGLRSDGPPMVVDVDVGMPSHAAVIEEQVLVLEATPSILSTPLVPQRMRMPAAEQFRYRWPRVHAGSHLTSRRYLCKRLSLGCGSGGYGDRA